MATRVLHTYGQEERLRFLGRTSLLSPYNFNRIFERNSTVGWMRGVVHGRPTVVLYNNSLSAPEKNPTRLCASRRIWGILLWVALLGVFPFQSYPRNHNKSKPIQFISGSLNLHHPNQLLVVARIHAPIYRCIIIIILARRLSFFGPYPFNFQDFIHHHHHLRCCCKRILAGARTTRKSSSRSNLEYPKPSYTFSASPPPRSESII